MNFYPLRFPAVFQKAFPSLRYRKDAHVNSVYLTFDDGPTDEVTEWVLNELDKYNAKATFFCIGKNIEKHPGIFKRIIAKNHKIGNHSYQHDKGWKTQNDTYLKSVMQTEKIIESFHPSSKLFRPPYGRIKMKQIKVLQAKGIQIVMWTSISGDFSQNLDAEKVVRKLSQKTKAGDILVFHDSLKAEHNLKAILPQLLQNLSEKGLHFDVL